MVGRPDDMTGEAVCAFVVLKQARPTGRRRREDREGAARLGRQGDRSDREAQGHPLRRQSAEDPLRQDHAAAAALDREGRGDHAGRLDARESGNPGTAEAGALKIAGFERSPGADGPIPGAKTVRTRRAGALIAAVRSGDLRFGRLRGARCGRSLDPVGPKATPVNDLQSTLFWLRLVQLVLAIPLLALAGQGVRPRADAPLRAGPEGQFLLPAARNRRLAVHAGVPLDHAQVRRRPAPAAGGALAAASSATSGRCWRSRMRA